MRLTSILIVVAAFVAGILASQAFASTFSTTSYNGGYELPADLYSGVTGTAIARTTPGDHVTDEKIKVYKDKVVLDIPNAIWAQFTPTHSMDPVLSEKANAIEVVPKSADEVNEGDIVAYKSAYADGIIIHRVIKKGEDQLGTYFIVKGDNNAKADPGLVRFADIKSVVVGIIY
jgi:hypothetical protein